MLAIYPRLLNDWQALERKPGWPCHKSWLLELFSIPKVRKWRCQPPLWVNSLWTFSRRQKPSRLLQVSILMSSMPPFSVLLMRAYWCCFAACMNWEEWTFLPPCLRTWERTVRVPLLSYLHLRVTSTCSFGSKRKPIKPMRRLPLSRENLMYRTRLYKPTLIKRVRALRKWLFNSDRNLLP